ncbi:MAG: hypothetical protein COT85_02360 [Chlamydiae bacterium CG10_big_fil_rev_8_21_14_0_10_42_34]|nr:MAG: hypothetical protein COT85_02360 [Chlamydiae bacterium CG10_big_fil_rev_8_21_14_0_10_42_34]
MAVGVSRSNSNLSERSDEFLEKHFVTLAFTVSTVALFAISPFSLISGASVGFFLNQYIEPHLNLKSGSYVITLPCTTISIVGAFAALLRLAPGSVGSSFAFKAVPLFASLAVGSTAYRFYKSL